MRAFLFLLALAPISAFQTACHSRDGKMCSDAKDLCIFTGADNSECICCAPRHVYIDDDDYYHHSDEGYGFMVLLIFVFSLFSILCVGGWYFM